MPLPPAAPGAAHDRGAAWAVRGILFAAAALAALVWTFAPGIDLWSKIGHVGNGLVGGTVAGAIAIAMYRIGRRSRSREKKFLLAGALCIELIGIKDALQRSLPNSGIDRSRARAAYRRASVRADYSVSSPRLRRPVYASDKLLQGTAGLVYRGLANSGGISCFEAAMQARLHRFYDHVGRAEYDMMVEIMMPLVRDVALFRDTNAPFALSSLVHLPRLRRTGRQGTRRHGTTAGSPGG